MKSFKSFDIGYSSKLDKNLFSGLENNDEYLLSKYSRAESTGLIASVNKTKNFDINYQHNGTSIDSDITRMFEEKIYVKENHIYLITLQIRSIITEDATSGGSLYPSWIWTWVQIDGNNLGSTTIGFPSYIENNGGLYIMSGTHKKFLFSNSYPSGNTDTEITISYNVWGSPIYDGVWKARFSSEIGSPILFYVQDLGVDHGI